MKAGQPSNPLPKNTLGRDAWYIRVKSTHENAHSTIILNSQQSGNPVSANRHVSKCIHTVQDHAQRRVNYCYSQQHGRLSVSPPIWKRTFCMTSCLWGSKPKTQPQWRRSMGGICSERQEESGRKDAALSILIWRMATQVHTHGKTHPAVSSLEISALSYKESVSRSVMSHSFRP